MAARNRFLGRLEMDADEYAVIRDALLAQLPHESELTLQDTIEGESHGDFIGLLDGVHRKRRGIERSMSVIEMEIGILQNEIRELKERHQRYRDKIDAIDNRILGVLERIGRPQGIERDTYTLRTKANPPRLVAPDNAEAVPEEYRRTKTATEVDRRKLLADLKAGVEVEGCSLSNAPPSLIVETHR